MTGGEVALLIVTIVLASAAIYSTGINLSLLRHHAAPHVVVYSKHDARRPTLILLVMENVGGGVAYDVHFELERDLPKEAFGIAPSGEPREVDPMNAGPLIDGIPMLAPGDRRVLNWGQYGGLKDALGGRPVRVKSYYKSRALYPWEPEEHISHSVLEVESFAHTDAATTPEQEGVKQLKDIARNLRTLAEPVRERQRRRALRLYEAHTKQRPAEDAEGPT